MDNSSESKPRKIVLIGMMGSGKSSTGRRLAQCLNYPFIDLDESIEHRAGRSIREIFGTDGEQAFRDLEQDELRRALAEPGSLVIAAGGGVVVRAANRQALADADDVIWLQASVEELARRVGARSKRQQGHRPLADGDPVERLSALLDERHQWYSEVATTVVVVNGRSQDDVVATMAAAFSSGRPSGQPTMGES